MKKSFLKKRILAGILAGAMMMSSLSGCGLDVKNDTADAEVEVETDENGNPVEDPRTAAERMEAYENPEEVYENPVTVEGHDEYTDLAVSVTADESVMNGAESVYIEPVYDSVDAWQELVDGIEDEALSREVLGVFDVSLLNGDRDRIEPDDSVVVSFSGPMIADAISDNRKLELYHLPNKEIEADSISENTVNEDVQEEDTDIVEGSIEDMEEEDPEASDMEEADADIMPMAMSADTMSMSASAFMSTDDETLSDDEVISDDEEIDEIISDDEEIVDEEMIDSDEETVADGTDSEGIVDESDSVSSNSVDETASGIVSEEALQTLSDVSTEEAEEIVEKVYPQIADESTVIFDATSFSEYALVLREDSDTQVETLLFGDDEYFEADKYLTVGGQYMNGQPTATITIEQAYYTDRKQQVEKAPARNDVVIALDATGSMGGSVHKTNEYTLYFLYLIMAKNQLILRQAAEGGYGDYIPPRDIEGNSTIKDLTFQELKDYDDPAFVKFKDEHLIYIDGILTFNSTTYTVKENTPLELIVWDDVEQILKCECHEGSDNRTGCSHPHYIENEDGSVTPTDRVNYPWCGKPKNGWSDWSAGTMTSGSPEVAGCVYSGPAHLENRWSTTFDPNFAPGNAHVLRAYTRTDLAAEQCKTWISDIRSAHPGDTEVTMLLCTDGTPCEPVDKGGWFEAEDNGTSNRALATAKVIKEDYDAHIFTAFLPTTSNKEFTQEAFNAIREPKDKYFKLTAKNPDNGFAYINLQGNPEVDTSDLLFMAMFSSDFKHGGVINGSSAVINTINPDIKINLGNGEKWVPCACGCPTCIVNRSYADKCDGELIPDDLHPGAFMCSEHGHQYPQTDEKDPNSSNKKDWFSDNLPENGNCTVVKTYDPGVCPTTCPTCANGLCPDCAENKKKSNVKFTIPEGGESYFDTLVNGALNAPYTIANAAGEKEDYNMFGDHMHTMGRAMDNNLNTMDEFINRMMQYMTARTNNNDTGYASSDSYIQDVITDPFEITDKRNIHVYKVPRTPKHIDPNTGIPQHENPDGTLTTLDQSLGCSTEAEVLQKLDNNDFRWPDQFESDGTDDGVVEMWTDITKDVIIDSGALENNVVRISGYNYEGRNACRNYDFDYCYEPEAIGDTGLTYKPGDYGYKIIVTIPINTYRSFGGNNIKTNNTDESGFFPSIPTWQENNEDEEVRKRPVWTQNTEKNPEGNEYILLYPECKMNLKLNYDIVNDNAVIYAPEMKAVRDIVTDASNMLFKVDEGYAEAQTILSNLKTQREGLLAELEEVGEGSAEAGEIVNKLGKLENDIITQEEVCNSFDSYIPNGINNMFVDIAYTLTSPSGRVIATMDIPHGTAYTIDYKSDPNGIPSIDWNITGGREVTVRVYDGQRYFYKTFRALTEDGNYKISCNIKPVATEKSPTWHAGDGTEYPLTSYTPTGSDGTDALPNNTDGDIGPSKGPKEFTATSMVKIFVLQFTSEDTKQEKETRIEINDGYTQEQPYSLNDLASSATGDETILRDDVTGIYDLSKSDGTNLTSAKWVCLDGVTASVKDNEPISDEESPRITTTLKKELFDDGLLEQTSDGSPITITAENGSFIPVVTTVNRRYRCVNKGWNTNDFVEGSPIDMNNVDSNGKPIVPNMTDNDFLYDSANNSSSVSWSHTCAWSETCNHSDGEMSAAQKTYGRDVQYLVHVFDNVIPEVHKKATDGNTIFTSGTFKWTITTANKDRENNEGQIPCIYSLIDILPHEDDGRSTAIFDQGTQLHGTMRYKSIEADLSNSKLAKDLLVSGKSKIYYTSDINVYKYPKSYTAEDVIEKVEWKEGFAMVDGDKCIFTSFGNDPIYAFKLDTQLAFDEELTVNIEADTVDPTSKKEGDVAINDAFVYIGSGFVDSEDIPIEVASLSIDGKVWIDEDFDNLISPGESGVSQVVVNLYRKEGNQAETPSPVLRTVKLSDGTSLNLVAAHDAGYNTVPAVTTDSSGEFSFTNLKEDTYYIVADHLPKDYECITKNAAGSRFASTFDSEAEEYYLDNSNGSGSDDYRDNTAFIKEIVVGRSGGLQTQNVKGMNIGIQQMNGEITIGKAVKTLKIPSTLSDEDRAVFKNAVTFYFKHLETGVTYTKELFLGEKNCMTYKGEPQVWGTVTGLPLGTYIVSETLVKENNDVTVHTEDSNVYLAGSNVGNANGIGKYQAVVKLTGTQNLAKLWYENEFLDTTGSYNNINMHIPVKLEIQYKGPNPVGNQNMTTYEFKREDFEDMIVTYDDGTQISLKEGTLRFEDVVLTPGSPGDPITRKMNTGTTGKPITVTGYYSEKGHVVKDFFSVRVNLKPLHKISITFDCNYESSEGGRGFGDSSYKGTNTIVYLFDEYENDIEVVEGSYKDVANGKLMAPWYYYDHSKRFRHAGWSTNTDGGGYCFDFNNNEYGTTAADILCGLGHEIVDADKKKISNGAVLHAWWRGNATFYANGTFDAMANSSSTASISNEGFLIYENVTDENDIPINQGTSYVKEYSKNAVMSNPSIYYSGDGRTHAIHGYVSNENQEARFSHWSRDRWNGQYGGSSDEPGKGSSRWFHGGESFYAIYYTTEFKYIGRGDAFIAPKAGTYTFKLWGSPGGNTVGGDGISAKIGGNGAYVETRMWLARNQKIYAFVGSAGEPSKGDTSAGGYNGGGPALVCLAAPHGSSGGGATHISTTNNPIMSDVFVKLLPSTGTDQIPSHSTYNSDPFVLYYGRKFTGTAEKKNNKGEVTQAAVPAASQAELISFVRQKLMADPYWSKYVNASTLIVEAGGTEASANINSDVRVKYDSKVGRSDNQNIGRASDKNAWFRISLSKTASDASTWDRSGTLAIAGGGGGAGFDINNYKKIGKQKEEHSDGAFYGFAGDETIADSGANGVSNAFAAGGHSTSTPNRATAMGRYKAADNGTGTGFAYGSGAWTTNASGGGGGWLGGFSYTQYLKPGVQVQSKGGLCRAAGGGGTSYYRPDNTFGGTPYYRSDGKRMEGTWKMSNSFAVSGGDSRIYPEIGTYRKPPTEGTNGYIKVENPVFDPIQ